jgi:hypothetical protein
MLVQDDTFATLVKAMIRAAGPAYRKQLIAALERDYDYSCSCGDGNFERAQRRYWNERIDHLIQEVKNLG